MSQASEGWQLIPEHYDDGGISGGTLERPALTRLLADIAAGRIDIVVVYKVDRLSRSLFDFAKLVEVFEKADVSFVSVTQSFNTTTSMGRLTLNMLLSFAQFEREVTAERIRDKLAASKAKGMWMGGTPPLGYRPDGRTLAIVEEHAVIVRDIYQRYIELGNVRHLAERLEAEAIRKPSRMRATGQVFGGGAFTRGELYKLLANPIYLGKIAHGGKLHAGLHAPIIDQTLWDAVQAKLADNTQGEARTRLPHSSLLAGLIVDASGEAMLASHASKKGVRYRYYVSRSLHAGSSDSGLRLPAREIEALVKEQAAQLLDDPLGLAAKLSLEVSPALLRHLTNRCADLAAALRGRAGGQLRDIVMQVRASGERLSIAVSVPAIAAVLDIALPHSDAPPLILDAGYRLTRTGRAIRLVQSNGSSVRTETSPALVNLIVQARKWWAALAAGEIDITTLAAREGVNDSYITRIVRIAFLSPAVIDAILEGRQHGALDAGMLRGTDAVPARWDQQAERFLPKTG
jgi:DNA invertase Pin-like site-specific DNA recombinase